MTLTLLENFSERSTQTEEGLKLVQTTEDANLNPSFYKTRSETLTAIEYWNEFILPLFECCFCRS